MELLNEWVTREGNEATFESLVLALEKAGDQATADFIKHDLFN